MRRKKESKIQLPGTSGGRGGRAGELELTLIIVDVFLVEAEVRVLDLAAAGAEQDLRVATLVAKVEHVWVEVVVARDVDAHSLAALDLRHVAGTGVAAGWRWRRPPRWWWRGGLRPSPCWWRRGSPRRGRRRGRRWFTDHASGAEALRGVHSQRCWPRGRRGAGELERDDSGAGVGAHLDRILAGRHDICDILAKLTLVAAGEVRPRRTVARGSRGGNCNDQRKGNATYVLSATMQSFRHSAASIMRRKKESKSNCLVHAGKWRKGWAGWRPRTYSDHRRCTLGRSRGRGR